MKEKISTTSETANDGNAPVICRAFVNVYKDADGRFLGDIEYDTWKLAYDGRDVLTTYVETVEIVRHGIQRYEYCRSSGIRITNV